MLKAFNIVQAVVCGSVRPSCSHACALIQVYHPFGAHAQRMHVEPATISVGDTGDAFNCLNLLLHCSQLAVLQHWQPSPPLPSSVRGACIFISYPHCNATSAPATLRPFGTAAASRSTLPWVGCA